VKISTFNEFVEGASREMKSIITECIASKDSYNYNDCYEIICSGIYFMDKKQSDINKHIQDYISAEKVRIDNILVEEQPNEVE
jgi:hypothetical protein